MIECRAILHERSHAKFKNKEGDASIGLKSFECYVTLDNHIGLKFFTDRSSKEEVFSIDPAKMNLDLDKNSSTLFFYTVQDQHPLLELKSDIGSLSKIEKFSQRKGKPRFKGPLSYTPAHRSRETIFSTGEINTNLRGFLNLALLALFFAKFRDIINNFLDYGMILTSTIEVSFSLSEIFWYGVSWTIPIFVGFWAEKLATKGKVPNRLVDLIEWINIAGLILTPIVVCHIFKPAPFPAFIYVLICISNILKLCSYLHVMHNLRNNIPNILELERKGKDVVAELGEHIISKENLAIILKHKNDISQLVTLKDLIYFFSIPTFCFQLWYPRNPKIRWNFVAKRIGECILCWALFTFILNQYIRPIMDESVLILERGSILEIMERIIRISFPSTVCWILFFFGTFQYIFNIQAELTRFADRQFYKDWWNCRDLSEYWRLWNLPIHEFLTRHVYFPLLRRGHSREVGKLVVFLLSAIFHEYWASVPLRLFAAWAFLAMLVQAPIMIIETKIDKLLKGSQIGNIFFWISFCFVGQPTALLLYYQLYLRKHGGEIAA